ncbi:tyrosine-type recombinase/integrase [Petroclostridium xylanilyticum]|uniref:tyrosine-type recombinase/integrase n=1 Tax=Petroclostridium xylanilyticum TaxID=1792311 RepID=UPI000B9892F9|nr:tyrosine-type recombinase/integrase [Petroclostridium xylanilyticum]
MKETILLSKLIDMTKQDLIAHGIKKKTIQLYQCYGFNLISRKHNEANELFYSEKLALEVVRQIRAEYEAGLIPETKFRILRTIAERIHECYETGHVQWRHLPHWGIRKLSTPFEKCLNNYVDKRLRTGCSITTMRGQKPIIRHFLFFCEDRGYASLDQLSKDDIVEYINTVAKKYSRVGDVLSVIRTFSDYLTENKMISFDMKLLLQIPAPAHRKYSSGFTQAEADMIVSAPDRTTACGKRDFAIMILAKNTGLRSIDILGLKFSDVDWNRKELRIVQHKTDVPLTLPIEIPVCNAIADYILHGRPQSESQYIFLRARPPYNPLRSWSGHSIVRRNAIAAGIEWVSNKRNGMHSFRRGLGNWMLEAEIPLGTISEVLGHTSSDSTKPYLALQESYLGKCPLSLDGIPCLRKELTNEIYI